jgi:hypothetical protein
MRGSDQSDVARRGLGANYSSRDPMGSNPTGTAIENPWSSGGFLFTWAGSGAFMVQIEANADNVARGESVPSSVHPSAATARTDVLSERPIG